MSEENKIHLKNLIIGSIHKDAIRIELDSQSQITQNEIYEIFEKIRWKYFGGRDHFNGLYFPLRFKRDEYSGEILDKGHFLLLSNQKTSKYFNHYGKTTFDTLVTLLSQHPTTRITVDLRLTYFEHYDHMVVKANIDQALIELDHTQPEEKWACAEDSCLNSL